MVLHVLREEIFANKGSVRDDALISLALVLISAKSTSTCRKYDVLREKGGVILSEVLKH